MFEGPLSASAYEVLGVAASASDDELRRAYRLRLRQTHPDTGGDAALFIRVQRAWEHVGTPAGRAAAVAHLDSLKDGLAFVEMVEAVKRRRLGLLLAQAAARPAALRHFSMPIGARIDRLLGRPPRR